MKPEIVDKAIHAAVTNIQSANEHAEQAESAKQLASLVAGLGGQTARNGDTADNPSLVDAFVIAQLTQLSELVTETNYLLRAIVAHTGAVLEPSEKVDVFEDVEDVPEASVPLEDFAF